MNEPRIVTHKSDMRAKNEKKTTTTWPVHISLDAQIKYVYKFYIVVDFSSKFPYIYY